MERGEEPPMPPHFALTFEREPDLRLTQRDEISQHRWEVAGAEAYPALLAVDEGFVVRPPTADEVRHTEAIALALPRLLSEKTALLDAWNGGEPMTRTLSVATHAG